MNVNWTEASLADVEALRAYVSRHSERYAQGLIERIFAKSELLSQHPLLGAILPEYEAEASAKYSKTPFESSTAWWKVRTGLMFSQ
jgi:plasmid stabilization system protein ParE